MSADWFLIGSTSILGLISYYYPISEDKLKKNNTQTTRYIFAFLIFAIIVSVTGLRTVYGDTSAYIVGFENYSYNISAVFKNFDLSENGTLFYFLSNLFKIFISDNYSLWLLTIAFVTALPIFYILYKRSEDFPLSTFLFITMGFYTWMMNGIRQFLAVAILFLAITLLMKKKYLLFISIFVIAYLIHQSAIVILPVVFLINVKSPWSRRVFLCVFAILICVFFADEFTDFFVETTGSDEAISNAGGSSIWWVIISAVPCVIAYIKREQIEKFDNKFINLSIIMAILATSFYLLSTFTSGIFIGRIPVYFSIYNLILLPWLIKNCYKGTQRAFLYFLCVLGYLGFFYLNMQPYYSEYLTFLY